MIQEFLKSLFLIFMAEMGDKTQILALAFATQYEVKEVLLGVFIGSLLNHGIAVLLGSYLAVLIPIDMIQIIAGFSFVGFALWTLRTDDEEEDDDREKKDFGPIMTVAIAFFIGELGDKTQLTAITLSVDAMNPLFVLMGTVTGMILTSGIGIIVGSKIGNKIPEFKIKIISASIFMFFGLTKLYNTIPPKYLTGWSVMMFLIILSYLVYRLIKSLIIIRNTGQSTALQETALTLYTYTQQIRESVENICLGEAYCGKCKGGKCIIGYTKKILDDISDNNKMSLEATYDFYDSLNKNFDKNNVIESLSLVISYLNKERNISERGKAIIHKVRKLLESILFNSQLEYNNQNDYFNKLLETDKRIGKKIINNVVSKTNPIIER